MFCPSCGKTISDKARFCQFCGSDVTQFDDDIGEPQAVETACPNCGFKLDEDAVFCDNCGTRISSVPEPVKPKPAVSVPTPVPLAPVEQKKADNTRQEPSNRPARKSKKGILIAVPLALVIGAAVFVFLWNGGSVWKGWFDSSLTGQTDDSEINSALVPSNTADGNQSATTDDIDAPPPSEPLTSDGTLDSALRLVAAAILSGTDSPDAEPWRDVSIHVTYLNGDDCNFAATMERDGRHYLLGQFSAKLEQNGGEYTVPRMDLIGETIWFMYGNGLLYNGEETVTNSDLSAITLIPDNVKQDSNMEFQMPDDTHFTFNGIQVAAGVHDTQENYDAYAQPTMLDCTLDFGDGRLEHLQIPLDVCGFQEYPTTYLLPQPYENVQVVSICVMESNGSQEYVAIAEISIF